MKTIWCLHKLQTDYCFVSMTTDVIALYLIIIANLYNCDIIIMVTIVTCKITVMLINMTNKTRKIPRRVKVFRNAHLCTHFHKKTEEMQLIYIKHTPFQENACILCKLDENACIFLHFH